LKQRTLVPGFTLAGLISGAALFLLVSLLARVTGLGRPLAAAGDFLFSTFLWSAFFLPCYLAILAGLILAGRLTGWRAGFLNLLLIPFLTVSLFHKVVLYGRIPDSYLPDLLVRVFGRLPAALVLFLSFLLELFLLLALRGWRASRLREAEEEPPEAPRLPEAGAKQRVAAREQEPSGSQPVVPLEVEPAEEEPGEPGEVEELSAEEPALEEAGLDEAQAREGRAAPAREYRAAAGRKRGYHFPVQGLLKDYPDGEYWEIDEETRRASEVLMKTLEEFKISAEVTGIRKGPVITMYEILPSPGVKISRIVALSDNIALRLAASRVRIVAPIPGKHAVGIEVPNKKRAIVSFKEMIELSEFQNARFEIPIALGKDIAGSAQMIDLTQTPHLLIAGATGSGKSVCVNSIICSILYKKSPEDVRFILIDPKIVELKAFNDIPHLLTPVVTEPKKTFQVMQYCLGEMERRYSLLDQMGVRDIRAYNRKAGKLRVTIPKIPYWVVVIDEFADLIAVTGKEMEAALARLAAMARAVGLHLVLATQRPSIEVITGLIKANIPSRIAFMVASKFDSRIIIDAVGAEKLLGQGDMLFSAAWDPIPVRIQGTYLSEEEVEAITAHARTLGQPEYLDEEIFLEEAEEDFSGAGADDPLMDEALQIVLAVGKASASYLQRRLKIGYNRAARLVEEMERMGVVGPPQGSKPREVLRVPDAGRARSER
jgi:S-DNA-T family DNA segregation ATPase FtsK/SpoIIIE